MGADAIFAFVQRMDSKQGERRPERITLSRKTMTLDEWELPKNRGDAQALDDIVDAIRAKAEDEASALTGRLAMRISGVTGRDTIVGTMTYVVIGHSNNGDMPDEQDDSPATSAAALALSQRHLEKFVTLASNALHQASEANERTTRHMLKELEAYRARDSEMIAERFRLIDIVSELFVGQAKANAEAIELEAQQKQKEKMLDTAMNLGGALVARLSGSPQAQKSTLAEMFKAMEPERREAMFNILSDEEKATVALLFADQAS